MSVEIPLGGKGGGHVAIIDEADRELVERHNWTFDGRYAIRCAPGADGRKRMVTMHRFLMGFPTLQVDHRNRDKLDNRRSNLREVPHAINLFNRDVQPNNTSGAKGVYLSGGLWRAYISFGGKRIWLGRHATIEAAVIARAEGEARYYGAYL